MQLNAVHARNHPGAPIEVEVLHGIALTIRGGAFCAVTGRSDSGKRTPLNSVGLFHRRPVRGL